MFCVGMLLRVQYELKTPFLARNHDVEGHIRYLQYVLSHWSIPPPHGGWEFFQPPLYYFLAAVAYRVGGFFGVHIHVFAPVQFLSLLLSLGTLAAGIWIGTLLFPQGKSRTALFVYSAIIATFPSLAFLSSRISNDVGVQCMAFLALGFLLRWWQGRRTRDWWFFSLSLAVGMLMKSNILLLYPAAVFSVFLANRLSLREKFLFLLQNVSILFIIDGWFFIPRFLAERDERLAFVGNLTRNIGYVPFHIRDFFTFNPLRVLAHPYLNPAHYISNFWGYFLRSAFFDNFKNGGHFQPLAMIILGIGMALIVLLLRMLILDVQRGAQSMSAPLWLVFFFHIAGAVVYRIVGPYLPDGNFRFVIVLVVPCAFYIVSGFGRLQTFIEKLHFVLACAFVLLCGMYLLVI